MHEAVRMFCSSGFEYCSPVCEQPEPSSSDKIPRQVVQLIVSQCYQYGSEFLVHLWYRVSQVAQHHGGRRLGLRPSPKEVQILVRGFLLSALLAGAAVQTVV